MKINSAFWQIQSLGMFSGSSKMSGIQMNLDFKRLVIGSQFIFRFRFFSGVARRLSSSSSLTKTGTAFRPIGPSICPSKRHLLPGGVVEAGEEVVGGAEEEDEEEDSWVLKKFNLKILCKMIFFRQNLMKSLTCLISLINSRSCEYYSTTILLFKYSIQSCIRFLCSIFFLNLN